MDEAKPDDCATPRLISSSGLAEWGGALHERSEGALSPKSPLAGVTQQRGQCIRFQYPRVESANRPSTYFPSEEPGLARVRTCQSHSRPRCGQHLPAPVARGWMACGTGEMPPGVGQTLRRIVPEHFSL